MKIYTGTCGGSLEKLSHIKRLGLGFAISSEPSKLYKDYSCFIDNGAFEAWRRGLPWSEKRFYDLLEKTYLCGLSADFVVAPDIVAGGVDSLRFSETWFKRLRPAKIALAVQDGMTIKSLLGVHGYSVIFVGGTEDWKWNTAKQWVDYAHTTGKKCHIGRCGKLEKLKFAKEIGADSVDSTSFVRNDSWHIIEEFLNPTQTSLF